ncbi:hypothetical protein [Mesorhizobium sp.]|uniref:hypothetical protein n=1 Tax=Mesorhizobium sp. TaxID=1871066 RepID=UPI00257FC240|nr:hypothetical protein [Mesorhizobium sp.]
MLDGLAWLAQASPHPAADAQSGGQVRVESERAIDASGTVIKVAAYVAEDVSTVEKRNRIVPSEFDRSPGQSSSLGNLFRAIDHPAVALSGSVAPRRPRMGYRELRITVDHLHEEAQGFVNGRSTSDRPVKGRFKRRVA